MVRILLIQGANMSWLGRRKPELYGTTTAAELDEMLLEHARAAGYELEIFYTDTEGEAIGRVHQAAADGVDGLVMNPAGFVHAGKALRDCILDCAALPYVEVHMTNLETRDLVSVLAEAADGLVMGFGIHSYLLGLDAMLGLLARR